MFTNRTHQGSGCNKTQEIQIKTQKSIKSISGQIISKTRLTTAPPPLSCLQVGKINLLAAQRREQHILAMVLSMVSCYMLCWMPYGIMALMATFGKSGLVTPMASVVPSVLAKFSTVVNPVIYMFFNSQVRGEGRMARNDDP